MLKVGVTTPQGTAEIALGERLFSDKRLSRDRSIACSSCHQPEHAFSDRKPLAQGIRQQTGTRNTPSLLNVAFNSSEFWDGRRDSLESQALDPLLNPLEHGLEGESDLLARIRSDPVYETAFLAAFSVDSAGIRARHVARALAAYERTLLAGNSAFDRFYFCGDRTALSAAAQRGLALFQGAARCDVCHRIEATGALFTDGEFHSVNIGLARIGTRLPALTKRVVEIRNSGEPVDHTIMIDRDISELGRFVVTLHPVDIGSFRTPSLRNVALTPPYMHDGSVPTLDGAVDREIYDRASASGSPLNLAPAEKRDLLEFLSALTSKSLVPTQAAGVPKRIASRTDRNSQ